jgi:hypothetical protein
MTCDFINLAYREFMLQKGLFPKLPTENLNFMGGASEFKKYEKY